VSDRLTDTRTALHAALEDVMVAAGWDEKRAHAHVPRQVVTPAGWVEVPTINPQAGDRPGVVATFAVFVALDGEDQAQAQAQDVILAAGWDAFTEVKVDGFLASIITAGPGEVDVGGTTQRGVVFSVQIKLAVRTLCRQTVVRPE
jgi:hypothetical protein